MLIVLRKRRKTSKPFGFVTVLVLFLMFVISLYAACTEWCGKAVEADGAVYRITTGKSIFTSVILIDESTDEESIDLFMQICRGFGLKVTFFIDADKLEKVSGSINKLFAEGHTAGLYLTDSRKLSRSGFMKYLAECNDKFRTYTGKYPKYCVSDSNPNDYASEVIGAYGQYYIGFGFTPDNGGDARINRGDIVKADLSSEDGIYAFAKAVSQGLKDGLKAVGMKEYINEYESAKNGDKQ